MPDELLPVTADSDVLIDQILSKPLERPYTSRFIAHVADDGRLLLALPPDEVRAPGPAVLLGAATRHADWLFENLARLWLVKQRPGLETLPLVVQGDLSAWQAGLLELCGYGEERLLRVPSGAMLACAELHVPSLPGLGDFVAPGAIEHLRRELRRSVPAASSAGRIYLARRRVAARRLVNEAEVETKLRANGFTTIDADNMEIRELLAEIAAADVVIGVQGAAMAHAFMAPPRATVGMIVAEGLQSARYLAPSAVLGQDFHFLLAEAQFASHERHDECDVVLPERVLDGFLASLRQPAAVNSTAL
jgi:capsular polysaccharide biosynthesis protein